ncbi:cell growth-regulating nucleolar protein [Daphnia sinensis]|uniref:Cell growth-regulating nucleolar protein n=1 Tax=Daphnia sinensis TaxID=1820382 RepID=A0AAD5LH07_9CRUS|nr:cell growth-regulating nucleolar protein [Daphnia sinensis]
MENTLVTKAASSFKKGILAKPNNSKRQAWMSLIDNCVKSVDNTNVELTSLFGKIGEAEKIPIKWNRINKPKFMIFLNNIDGYQVNPKIDEQSWNLISKALIDERKNKAKSNTTNGSKKHTETNKVTDKASGNKENKDVISGKGNMKLKKESGSPVEETSFEEKRNARKLAKKLARQNNAKNKLIDNVEWTNMIQSLVQQVDVDNEELKNHLQRISHAPNIPQKAKWSSMSRPKFMTFLMNIPAYKVDPTIIDSLWDLIRKRLKENKTKSVKSKTSEKIKTGPKQQERKQTWISICQNIIVNNKDKELKKSLQIIAQAEKIPRHLKKLSQKKFMAFLQNLPTYQVNPATDEKIWNLFCEVLEEHKKNMALKVDEVNHEDEVAEKGIKRKAAALNENLFKGNKKVKKEAEESSVSKLKIQ